MDEHTISWTPDEILARLRAEFDFLWEKHKRDDGGPGDGLAHYAVDLENLILNRLGEAGLRRGQFGEGGIAAMDGPRGT